MANKKLKGSILLFLTAFIWGAAFVAQKIGIVQVGTLTFTAARFYISGLALLPIILFGEKKNKFKPEQAQISMDEIRSQRNLLIKGGTLCGIFLGLATIVQRLGMINTTVGKAGFITALYIIFVPILGIFRKKKVAPAIWFSVIVAFCGLYLLCVHEGLTINEGDALVFLCAFLFAFHILIIDYFSPYTNGVKLSCIQFFVAAIISTILMLFFEKFDIKALLSCWAPLLYLGIVSGALGFTLQILGQKYTEPTVASLILSMESVFAAIAGGIFLNERFSIRELIGCLLVFGAIICSQISSSKHSMFINKIIEKRKKRIYKNAD